MHFTTVLFLLLSLCLTQVAVANPAQNAVPVADQLAAKTAAKTDADELQSERPATTQRIAILDMVAMGDQQEIAKMLTEVLSVEASRVPGLEVIGMGDIAAIIGFEQQKQLIGCTDDACLAEIGGALGVRAILSSKIGKVGDTSVLSMRLVDTQAAKLLASVYKTVSGKPDALIKAVQQATPELLGVLSDQKNSSQKSSAQAAASSAKSSKDPAAVSYKVETPFSLPAWPGYVVMALGTASILVSVGLGYVAWNKYSAIDERDMEQIDDDTILIGAGAQGDFQWARGLGIASLATAGGGLLFILAGAVYENFTGGQE